MTTPQIIIENNGVNIMPKVEELLAQDKPDIEEGRKFLDENYNMGKFQEAVTELFNTKNSGGVCSMIKEMNVTMVEEQNIEA